MTDLVFAGDNNQLLTSSLIVADTFGKEHKHVMRAISEITSAQNWADVENQCVSQMFALEEREVPMPAGGGTRKEPFYVMTRDGFALLVMGFTGKKAFQFKVRFIAAFNRMEKQLTEHQQIPSAVPSLREAAAILTRLADTADALEARRLAIESKESDLNLREETLMRFQKRLSSEADLRSRMERIEKLLARREASPRIQPARRQPRASFETLPCRPRYTTQTVHGVEAATISKVSLRIRQEHPRELGHLTAPTLYSLLRGAGWLGSADGQHNRPSAECLEKKWMVCGGSSTSHGKLTWRPYFTEEGYRHLVHCLTQGGFDAPACDRDREKTTENKNL